MLATVAAMGLRGKYVGVIGNDANGERIRGELTRLGLDIGHTIVREAPNPYAVILVDESSGERMVLWDRDEAICDAGATSTRSTSSARPAWSTSTTPISAARSPPRWRRAKRASRSRATSTA